MKCRKCGSEKMGVMPNKKNPSATDLYCTECGAWQKFATRDEIRLYQTRKSTTTNADRIRAMTDDELAEFIDDIAAYVAHGEYCAGFLHVSDFPYSCLDTKECCEKHVVDWLKRSSHE